MVNRLITTLLIVATIGMLGYFNQESLKRVGERLYADYFPCRSPITYSVGSFDTRFKISRADFIAAIQEAERIWEGPTNLDLFQYVENEGQVSIELKYDERQAATNKLGEVNDTIDKKENTFTALETEIALQKNALATKESAYSARVAVFEQRQKAYSAKVTSWNRKGGAPSNVHAELEAEKTALSIEYEKLETMRTELNQEVAAFNIKIDERNQLAKALNKDIETYNTIGKSQGDQFTEGEYTDGARGAHINVYEFASEDILVRLLAHELGHALGIEEHVDDPEAIMYYLNNGKSMRLSSDDVFAAYAVCGVKN